MSFPWGVFALFPLMSITQKENNLDEARRQREHEYRMLDNRKAQISSYEYNKERDNIKKKYDRRVRDISDSYFF